MLVQRLVLAWNIDRMIGEYTWKQHRPNTGSTMLHRRQRHVKPLLSNAVQSQKAVSAYFSSKQIPPFGFAEQLLS